MKGSFSSSALAIAGFAILCLSSGAQALNLLTNPGFETGNLNGYTVTGVTTYTTVRTTPNTFGYIPHSGSYYLNFGTVGSDLLLSQTIATTPGVTYNFSAYLAGNGTSPSDFKLIVNGITKLTILPVPSQGYIQYSVSAVAIGTSTTFTLGLRNDPNYDAVDDLSVTAVTTAVPEPGALALLVTSGLSGAGFLIRRRRQAHKVA